MSSESIKNPILVYNPTPNFIQDFSGLESGGETLFWEYTLVDMFVAVHAAENDPLLPEPVVTLDELMNMPTCN